MFRNLAMALVGTFLLATEPSVLLVERSDEAYALFAALDAASAARIPAGPKVHLLPWKEASRRLPEELKRTIRRVDYPDYPLEKALLRFLEANPGAPLGVTWNGGTALTRMDYSRARKGYEASLRDPKMGGKPPAKAGDPNHPEHHLGPR